MKNQSGQRAEAAAAIWLTKLGYRIIDRNWRRPDCEIDIIASKNKNELNFFEVKYRHSSSNGSPLEMINKKKVKAMAHAASRWIVENSYNGSFSLGAVSVIGEDYKIEEILENLEIN